MKKFEILNILKEQVNNATNQLKLSSSPWPSIHEAIIEINIELAFRVQATSFMHLFVFCSVCHLPNKQPYGFRHLLVCCILNGVRDSQVKLNSRLLAYSQQALTMESDTRVSLLFTSLLASRHPTFG